MAKKGRKPFPWTPSLDAWLLELREKGVSLSGIAVRFGLSVPTIQRRLGELGTKVAEAPRSKRGRAAWTAPPEEPVGASVAREEPPPATVAPAVVVPLRRPPARSPAGFSMFDDLPAARERPRNAPWPRIGQL